MKNHKLKCPQNCNKIGFEDNCAMLSKCRALRSQKQLYIGTQAELEDEEDRGTLCDERTSLIHALFMLFFNPIGNSYTQLPNSENIGEVLWMPWVYLVAQAELRSKVVGYLEISSAMPWNTRVI